MTLDDGTDDGSDDGLDDGSDDADWWFGDVETLNDVLGDG